MRSNLQKTHKYSKILRNIESCAVAVMLMGVLNSQSASAQLLINGAGATFPQPLYTRWFSDYRKIDKAVAINYQGVGSSGGIRQTIAGTVDFGATDEPMKPEELKKAKSTIHHIPMAMGAVALTYNLPGNPEIKLTGDVIVDIFSGKISKWNDPRIAATNPSVKLPALVITVAYRSDGSGTTAIMTEYLSRTSSTWKATTGQGKSVKWPVGIGGKGNAGVAGIIKQNPGTFGYVELVFASTNKLPVAAIQNPAGEFTKPELESIAAAAAARTKEIIASGFKASLISAPGKTAYPITSMTWLLVPENMPANKSGAFKKFLDWSMGDQASKTAASLHYAPLPKSVRTRVLDQIKSIRFQ